MQTRHVTMKRDCSTSRMSVQELVGLINTMSPLDRQTATTEMEPLRQLELVSVPVAMAKPRIIAPYLNDLSPDAWGADKLLLLGCCVWSVIASGALFVVALV